MNRVRIILLLVCVATGTGIVLSDQWHARLSSSQSNTVGRKIAKLVVASGSFDIGKVWETDEFMWDVTVENQESEPIQVIGIDTNCNCLSVDPWSFRLGQGEKQKLRLKMNLTASASPDIAVLVRAKVRNTLTNEVLQGPDWELHGTIQKILSIDRSIDLGSRSELAQPVPTKIIPVEIVTSLEKLGIESDVPGEIASINLPKDGIGKTLLRVDVRNPHPVGRLDGLIRLHPIGKGIALPEQRIKLSGSIVNDVTSDPPGIQRGGYSIGDSFQDSISLRSLTGVPFSVLRTDTVGSGLLIRATESSTVYNIHQIANESGPVENKIVIVVSVAGKRETVVVPIRYLGVRR